MEHLVPNLCTSLQHHHHLYIVITSKDGTSLGSCMAVVWKVKAAE